MQSSFRRTAKVVLPLLFSISALLILLTYSVSAAPPYRQWATGATATSEFSNPEWAAFQATGAPDTVDGNGNFICQDTGTAWASAGSTEVASLTVTYDVPVIASEINIYEVWAPGSIISVEVVTTGDSTILVPNSASTATDCPRVFSLPVSLSGDPVIDTIIITVDQTIGGSWNEIDAVELVGTPASDIPARAFDDQYATTMNTPLPLDAARNLLANDEEYNDDPITASLESNASNGTVSLNSDGRFVYTPNLGFFGVDTFTYVANDGTADSNVATVSITVDGSNSAPVAIGDAYTTQFNTPLPASSARNVLSNDTDANGDPLTATLVSGPSHATTFSFNANGQFSYTPQNGYSGSDTFTYSASDGMELSSPSTVTITVFPLVEVPEDAPVALNDYYGTDINTALTVGAAGGVLANDSDVNGQVLTAAIVTQPPNGTVTLNADGSFTYTPDRNFRGADTFTYRASDGQSSSNIAAAIITVTGTIPQEETLGNLEVTDILNEESGAIEPEFYFTLPSALPDVEWFKLVVVDAAGNILFGGGDSAFVDWFPAERYCLDGLCEFNLDADNVLGGAGLLAGQYRWSVILWGPESGTVNPDPTEDVGEIDAQLEPPGPPQNIDLEIVFGVPTVSWDNDPLASWYLVVIGGEGEDPVVDAWFSKEDADCDTERCTYAIQSDDDADLQNQDEAPGITNGSYELEMQAWGPGGFSEEDPNAGDSGVTFELQLPPPQPASIPQDYAITNTVSGSPTFRWTPDPNSTWQLLWVGTPTGLPEALTSTQILTYHIKWYPVSKMDCVEGLGQPCLFTPDDVFLANGQYEYWVLSWGPGTEGGAAGFLDWVQGPVFNVDAPAPEPAKPLTPTGLTTTSLPSFGWKHVGNGATWYNLWVGTVKEITGTGPNAGQLSFTTYYSEWHRATEIGCLNSGTNCFVSPEAVWLPPDNYSWYIQSYNPAWVQANADTYWSIPPGEFTVERK